ncbi:MAG: hypothetical protein M0P57_03915 [Syntrophales bacterium]|nr:hypothetical protein [Syntrophales bacterium]MDY0044011.1 hypothetical protein [Syntrophales bacterium]
MNSLIDFMQENPYAVMIIALIALLALYFLLKKVMKLFLILGILLLVVAGYYYYKAPEKFPVTIQSTVKEVKDHSGKLLEKSREMIKAGKQYVHKIDGIVEKGSALISEEKEEKDSREN